MGGADLQDCPIFDPRVHFGRGFSLPAGVEVARVSGRVNISWIAAFPGF